VFFVNDRIGAYYCGKSGLECVPYGGENADLYMVEFFCSRIFFGIITQYPVSNYLWEYFSRVSGPKGNGGERGQGE
jgi:hypothetical protein